MPSGAVYIFEGDQNEPIAFVLVKDQGLVYLDDKGMVTLVDGKVIELPCGD